MRYKKSIVTFSLIIIMIGGIWHFFFKLTSYVPVIRVINNGEHSLVYDKSLLSKDHLNAICTIFSEYGVHYKLQDDAVLISPRLYRNKDLMQNYTHKAIYLNTTP